MLLDSRQATNGDGPTARKSGPGKRRAESDSIINAVARLVASNTRRAPLSVDNRSAEWLKPFVSAMAAHVVYSCRRGRGPPR
jgi:hypothetical protein